MPLFALHADGVWYKQVKLTQQNPLVALDNASPVRGTERLTKSVEPATTRTPRANTPTIRDFELMR